MPRKHPYEYFLNGFDPDSTTMGELTRRALTDVRASGLSTNILERAQVQLFKGNTDELKKRLHFAHVDGNPILRAHRLIEFPHVDSQGDITRYEYKPFPSIQFKNEKEPRRYLQGKGDEPTPYIIPDVWAVKDKINRPLWITEGVKKALKLNQHGRLTIGLSGVWNFRGGKDRHDQENTQLFRDLESFKWTGRTVSIAFDDDLWINPQVRRALYELAFTLYQRGALLRFPVWQGAKGIDDYLVLQDDPDKTLTEMEAGAKDLEHLICSDHRNEIMKALYHMTGQGVNERTLIEKVAKGLGQKAKDIKNDIARQRHNALKQAVDNTLYPYFINEAGGVCRWRRERDGNEAHTELSNFTARIVEDVTIDTGIETTRRFTIEGGTKDKTFPRASVKTSEFLNLNWVVNNWGNDAIIRAGQSTKDYLREFIQVYSNHNSVKRRIVYGHTGWRLINGSWAYLMANGAIGADSVDVELPVEFLETGRYCLPRTPEHEKETLDAILSSFLDIGKPEIFFPSLAYVFLSPLTGLLDPMPSFSLYFYGERDTFKTTVAVLMLSFFGAHTKRGLSNFDSTANQIMHRAAILKDTLMIVDDYYPSSRQKEALQKESIAQRIVRDVGNRTGRGRLNPDASEKPIPSPRGMIVITGEELPGLQSTLSRLVAIEFSQKDINPAKLAEAQEKAGLFPQAMTGFIVWLKDHIPSLQASFLAELYQLRKAGGIENSSKKIPEHIAYLRFSWKLFLQWAVDKAGLMEDVSRGYLDMGYEIFNKVADRHAARVEFEDPVKFFFEIISALFTQGKLRLDHKDSGYSGRIGGDSGELIGYFDDESYYLLPVPLWHAVQTYLRFEGGHFPFSKSTLYETLERRGLLEARGGKNTQAERIRGKVVKVLTLKRGENDLLKGVTDEA